MDDEETRRKEYKKCINGLGTMGVSLLVSSVILGPLAATIGSGMVVGVGIRKLLNFTKEIEYKNAFKKEEKQVRVADYSSSPESPETAIARKEPILSKRLLEEITRNDMYKRISEESVTIAKDYLKEIREVNPEKFAKSTGIYISVEEDSNRGLAKFLFGTNNKGYKVNISLKENDIE